jgi:L-lactate dehydrogenase complex protein LldE
MKVALFVPCLTERFDPRVAEATARVLQHLGLAVDVPTAQTCCGQPLQTLGDPDGARALALRMSRVFAAYDAVVTPSASCAGFVRHASDTLGPRLFELSDFLVTQLDFDASRATWSGRVALHPSCHQREVALTGRLDHTRELLSKVNELELVELPRATQCCGFGGAFSTAFPAVSVALGADKLDAFDASGADTLVTNDGGCRLHLRGVADGHRRPTELKHLAEILAEGLHLMPRPPRLRRAFAPTPGVQP